MCGIAGLFSLVGDLPQEAHGAVCAMTESLAHRGPDGEGYFESPAAILGHRRLAVIDLHRGRQPMANEDNTVWVVFNGEIYNHRRLRALLEDRGHRFHTSSDTEVILHAYEEFGTACVERFEGMFAFVIVDLRRRELFAARDRLGKKPLFYTVINQVLCFASELTALGAVPGWSGELDLTGLEGYLSLGYFVAPATIYRGTFKLPPAHWLRVRNGRLETRRYWDIQEFDTDDRDDGTLVSEIDRTLRVAVHDRLESDVPLGALLSGGIDSGLVVSYMSEVLGDRLVTVSVGFGQKEHNELDAAQRVGAFFSSRHHAQIIQPSSEDVVGEVVAHLGEPMADASAIPTWFACRTAREHLAVVLSGDGGDESFLGYDFRYVPHALEASVRHIVPPALAPLALWLGARWPRSPRLPRPLRAGTLVENLGRDPAAAYYSDLAFMKPHDARLLMGTLDGRDPTSSPVYAAVTEPYRRCTSHSAVQRAAYADLTVYLPNDPLVKLERMSMAHGLEVRCPMLDRRVVELAFRIPASRKQQGYRGKVLLRKLARRRLPPGLWRLPKRGFAAPIGEWIATSHADRFQAEVFERDNAIGDVIDRRVLQQKFAQHQCGAADHGYTLWAAWVLSRWLRIHEEGASRRRQEALRPKVVAPS